MSDLRDDVTATHPSGWWKARDGKWYPAEQQPGAEPSDNEAVSTDLVTALSIAVGAIVIGSLLPWSARGTEAAGNLTLLFGGVAGALVARWWLFSREHRGLLTLTAVLSAGASAVRMLDLTHLASAAGRPSSGACVATVGALMATALAFTARRLEPITAR